MLKNELKLLLRRIASLLFKILWIFPVRENRFFFQSYEGAAGYIGNPKYIAEYLIKEGVKCEIAFSVSNSVKPPKKEIRFIRFQSFQWLYYLATSAVIVFNVRAPIFLSRRKRQLIINTWHAGGAYKRIGLSIEQDNRIIEYSNKRNREYFNLFLSSSRAFTESNIQEAIGYTGRILNCGMPRNDLFFDAETVNNRSRKIRERFGLGNAFLILVAPTFYSEGSCENPNFTCFPFEEIEKKLKSILLRDVVFMMRKHHRDRTVYNFEQKITDVSGYDDVQELMCAADMLITDYSSIMWDFCLLRRPILFYIPDVKNYMESDRGFYTPPKDWPGVVCDDPGGLEKCLEKTVSGEAGTMCEQHLQKMGSYESGNASDKVMTEIIRHTV